MKTKGIHHITGIAGDPQQNLDFYAGVLGMRLIKKTVNFDDPFTYHFYFGDEAGMPGTILTFFPWTADGQPGRRGAGQTQSYAFSIPRGVYRLLAAKASGARRLRLRVCTRGSGRRFSCSRILTDLSLRLIGVER